MFLRLHSVNLINKVVKLLTWHEHLVILVMNKILKSKLIFEMYNIYHNFLKNLQKKNTVVFYPFTYSSMGRADIDPLATHKQNHDRADNWQP